MRPIIVGLVVLALLSVPLLGGCGGGGGGSTVNSVNGYVFDAGSRAAIAGARVVLTSGVQTTTDANGFFEFTSPGGVKSASVTATGYLAQTVALPSDGGDVGLGNIYLVPAPVAGYGNISGVVVEAGLPIAGAIVTCAGRTARTDGNGRYTLYNVLAGSQTVTARNPSDGDSATVSVFVTTLQTVTANIQVTVTPPPPPVT